MNQGDMTHIKAIDLKSCNDQVVDHQTDDALARTGHQAASDLCFLHKLANWPGYEATIY